MSSRIKHSKEMLSGYDVAFCLAEGLGSRVAVGLSQCLQFTLTSRGSEVLPRFMQCVKNQNTLAKGRAVAMLVSDCDGPNDPEKGAWKQLALTDFKSFSPPTMKPHIKTTRAWHDMEVEVRDESCPGARRPLDRDAVRRRNYLTERKSKHVTTKDSAVVMFEEHPDVAQYLQIGLHGKWLRTVPALSLHSFHLAPTSHKRAVIPPWQLVTRNRFLIQISRSYWFKTFAWIETSGWDRSAVACLKRLVWIDLLTLIDVADLDLANWPPLGLLVLKRLFT